MCRGNNEEAKNDLELEENVDNPDTVGLEENDDALET